MSLATSDLCSLLHKYINNNILGSATQLFPFYPPSLRPPTFLELSPAIKPHLPKLFKRTDVRWTIIQEAAASVPDGKPGWDEGRTFVHASSTRVLQKHPGRMNTERGDRVNERGHGAPVFLGDSWRFFGGGFCCGFERLLNGGGKCPDNGVVGVLGVRWGSWVNCSGSDGHQAELCHFLLFLIKHTNV